MRTLLSNEIKSVTGAGYSEDITTAAASIYVGSFIGRAAAVTTAKAFAGAVGVLGGSGLSPLGFALGTMGSVLAPIMYFAAPVAVYDAVYPGAIQKWIDSH